MLKGIRVPEEPESNALLGGADPALKNSTVRLMNVMREYELLSADLDVSPLFSVPLD
jgi:hypothetical protein